MRTAAAASPHLGVAGRLETPLRRAFFCTHFRGADRPANSGANLAGSQKQAMRFSRRNGVLDSKKPLSFLKRPVETTSSVHAGCFAVLGLLHENGIDKSASAPKRCIRCFLQKSACFSSFKRNQKLGFRDIPAYCVLRRGAPNCVFSKCFITKKIFTDRFQIAECLFRLSAACAKSSFPDFLRSNRRFQKFVETRTRHCLVKSAEV